MDKSKAFTGLLIFFGVLLLLVVLYAIFAKKTTKKQTGDVVTTQGGLGGFITGLFGGSGNWLGNIFGGGGAKYKCDCNNPGYTRDGDLKESCREGRIDYQIDCE